MAELPAILRLLGWPTKAFYDAFRHSQKWVQIGAGPAAEDDDDANPLVGFRISLFLGFFGLAGLFRVPDPRTAFAVVVAFTGLSCAWQLRPFWRRPKPLHGRVPRPGIANWLLSHHAGTSVVTQAVGIGALALCLGHSGFFDALDGKAVWGIVLFLVWLPFNRFVFVNLAVLELLKQHVAARLHFAVFRRFQTGDESVDPGFDRRHRTILLPILGSFGKVLVVHNDSLAATRPGPNPDSEEINAQTSMAFKFSQEDWVHGISELIGKSDIAVFHWGSVMSQSMLLELREAERVHSPERMILVVDGNAAALLALCRLGINLSMHVMRIGDDYGECLAKLRHVIVEIAGVPATERKSASGALSWNANAWEVLHKVAALQPTNGPQSGTWHLPDGLGGGECEMVFAAGHVMGRGGDETGWFQVHGSYTSIDQGTELTLTQHYVGGSTVVFQGCSREKSTITVKLPSGMEAEMTYVSAD